MKLVKLLGVGILVLALAACEQGGDALTLSVTVEGSGSVISTPGGIDCSSNSTCTAEFAKGTSVSLDAAADAETTFRGWSGACISSSGCTLTMNRDKAVTATFGSAAEPTTPEPEPDPSVPNPVPEPPAPDPSAPPSPEDDPGEPDPSEPDPTETDPAEPAPPEPTVNSVTVTPETAFLVVNATLQLSAAVDAEEGADTTVTWFSSNDIIATVNDSGVVTGVVEGIVSITATSNADPTKADSAELTVVSNEP